MTRTRADGSAALPETGAPTVLVVLVVHDGARWLRDCVEALSTQDHPRLAIVAVDNGSSDGSRELLELALGPTRVLALPENRGLPGALRAALELPVTREADYIVLLHDDAVLSPGAVSAMVAAAEIEGVGVVGPKVVDWDDPRVLREVGRSTDRFGFPYSPLETGEIDHGQYDRVREVLFVSSCAMLMSRRALERTGLPDERLASRHDDLDFCWRARLAGFRVLMTPLATARHRGASERGERGQRRAAGRSRYFAERAALASMLKNYGVPSLSWVLPLYVVQGLVKVVAYLIERRFEDAYQVLAAWGWNLLHLPSTIARRARAQSVRVVRDREVRRYMAPPTVRLRRWFETAGAAVEIRREAAEEEEEAVVPLRARATSFARAHPVLVAWVLALVVCAVAERRLFSSGTLEGGVLASYPANPSGFFAELVSGVRTTALGGAQAASPALGLLGAASAVAFGNPALAQKALLGVLPLLAALAMYRALGRQAGGGLGSVLASAVYGLSPVVLWAFSQGRIDVLVGLTVLPVLADRLDFAFGSVSPTRSGRFAVGTGLIAAIGVGFQPGVLLGLGVFLAFQLLFAAGSRIKGIRLTVTSLGIAAALVFPTLTGMVQAAGATFGSHVGTAEFSSVARLVLGRAPGSWAAAWFLPAGALLSFAVVGPGLRGRAYRALLVSVSCVFLAWTSAAGYLPRGLSNPVAYTEAAAIAEVLLIGYGLASVSWVGRQAFGSRQVVSAVLGALLVGGLALQAGVAVVGGWDVGPDELPPAWPLVAARGPDQFRVLWIGRIAGRPFPAPGGDPQGVVEDGGSSLRYAIHDRNGLSALDTGRAAEGPGYGYIERVMSLVLTGTTEHAGALLGPLGVRYVVAEAGDLPERVAAHLEEQQDLDLVPAAGLVIYRNAEPLPPAAAIASEDYRKASRGADLLAVAEQGPPPAKGLDRIPGGWTGDGTGSGMVLLADRLADGWQLSAAGKRQSPKPAFGWATGFAMPSGRFTIEYSRQRVRTAEVAALGILWLAALWMTRKRAER